LGEPSSKFSRMASACTRVPFRIGAALTFRGLISTMGQSDQSMGVLAGVLGKYSAGCMGARRKAGQSLRPICCVKGTASAVPVSWLESRLQPLRSDRVGRKRMSKGSVLA
jgi:hypothetical protein